MSGEHTGAQMLRPWKIAVTLQANLEVLTTPATLLLAINARKTKHWGRLKCHPKGISGAQPERLLGACHVDPTRIAVALSSAPHNTDLRLSS
jgi:hypothetical protein